MAEWLVVYRSLINNPRVQGEFGGASDARTLVVEASTRVDAFCGAFDHLTRSGLHVRFPHRLYGIDHLLTKEEQAAVVAKGVPKERLSLGGPGDIVIDKLEPYAIAATGRVQEIT